MDGVGPASGLPRLGRVLAVVLFPALLFTPPSPPDREQRRNSRSAPVHSALICATCLLSSPRERHRRRGVIASHQRGLLERHHSNCAEPVHPLPATRLPLGYCPASPPSSATRTPQDCTHHVRAFHSGTRPSVDWPTLVTFDRAPFMRFTTLLTDHSPRLPPFPLKYKRREGRR